MEIIKTKYGINALEVSLDTIVSKLKELKLIEKEADMNVARGVDLLWKSIRKEIAGPGFLINVPVYLEPLAKRNRNNPKTVERFQVVLAGSEMGKRLQRTQ